MTDKKIDPILLYAAFVFIFLMGISKVSDYDAFFHLATGKYILNTGQIVHSVDPFAFTPVKEFSIISWLSGVIFFVIHSFLQMKGLIIFKTCIIALAFFFIHLNMKTTTLKEHQNVYIFILILIVVAFAVRMRMFIRPHIFEFVLIPVFFYIFNVYRIKKQNYLYILPLLQVLWVNSHGSFILGILISLTVLSGESLKYFLRWNPLLSKRELMILCVVTFFIIAATMLNPSHYKVFLFPFMLTGQQVYMSNIGEWLPLSINLLIGYGFRYTWAFSLLLISAIIIFGFQKKKTDLTNILIVLFFFYLALKGVRLTSVFAIGVGPIVAEGFCGIISRFSFDRLKRFRLLLTSACLAIIVAIFYISVYNSTIYAFGLDLKERVFPVKAVDFLINSDIKGNMLNSRGFGGYLIWRLFPNKKVFIDGRNEVYSEEFYKDYLYAHKSPEIWEKVVNQYDIDWVILEYSRDYSKKERINHLVNNPEWALIYWDRVAIVYAKRNSRNDDIIKKYEYKYIRPNDLNPTYLSHGIINNKSNMEQTLNEIKRNLFFNPDNEESHIALAYIYYMLGMHDYEFKEMKKAVEINPKVAFVRSALGEILLKRGDYKDAEKEFRKALKIDPTDKTALNGLQQLKR